MRRPELLPTDAESPAQVAAEDERVTAADLRRAARARRKVFRGEMRRFTARSRRRRLTIAIAIGAVALVAAVSVGVPYTPLFAVQSFHVTGVDTPENEKAIQDALSAEIGTPISLLDANRIQTRLQRFVFIESFLIEARPPHDVTVRIVERTPVGAVSAGNGYVVVDAAGVKLSTASSLPEGVPVLEVAGGVDSAAFRSAGRAVLSLPESIGPLVVGVAASTADDVVLTLATGSEVVWGNADDSAYKGVVLATLMTSMPGAGRYDVSSPDVPTVTP